MWGIDTTYACLPSGREVCGRKKMKKIPGFTLIEMMVVIAIFSMIMASIFGVLAIGRSSWYQGTTQIDTQQEARKAMDKIVRELRESGSQKITIGASQVTFQISTGVDANGQIIWGACTNWADNTNTVANYAIKYYLSSNKLYRSVLNSYPSGSAVGTDTIMANNVLSLTFTGNGPPVTIVDLAVVTQKTVLQGGSSLRNLQFTLNSKATLRN